MTLLPYRPHPLLRSGHLQTLMVGIICGDRPDYHARPIKINLGDGESIIVHEELGAPISEAAPLVVLLHGLGGDHRSAYLERLAPRLRKAGFKVWRVDLRGCGAGVPHAWRPANAGCSEDLAAVVRAAIEAHPDSSIRIVGFSLSGNILLKMLGEAAAGASQTRFDLARVATAIAVAPPVNLHHCADNMDRLSRKVYTHYYLKMLAEQVALRRQHWPQWESVSLDPAVKTIRQFDSRFTAPLSGFATTDEYYTLASAAPWLKYISTPTTVLVDRHDPIVTAKSFDEAVINPESTHLEFTRHGGHMGYFGIDEQGRMIRWMEYFVAQMLKT